MSRIGCTLLSLVSLALSACGEGVHSGESFGEPLVTLRARIEGQAPSTATTGELSASMIWAAMPAEFEECMEAAIDEGEIMTCMEGNRFVPALATNSVPVQPVFPASFEIPLYTLPSPAVLSGSPGALFGYGILVVYDDGNTNGELDLVDSEATSSVDTVLGASAPTGQHEIGFVVYREGALSPVWKMFSLFGCGEPEQGFSVIRMVMDEAAGTLSCVVRRTNDTTLAVYFEDSEEMRSLVCEAAEEGSTYPAAEPPPGATVECYGPDFMRFASNPSAYCRHWQTYRLSGCFDPLDCSTPDWDLTASPPDWWPCGPMSSGGFTLIDDPSQPTSGSETLFTITYDSGDVAYSMDDMAIWVYTAPNHVQSLTVPWTLELIDNDSDGKLSVGDTLRAFETMGMSVFDESHAGTTFDVSLVQDKLNAPVRSLADFRWMP